MIRYSKLRAYARYTGEQAAAFLSGIRRTALWVSTDESLHIVKDDESDNRFIELAAAGHARYLITGDRKHLLPLKR